jgi:hypothetical protein
MTYTADSTIFRQQVETAAERAGGGLPVWAGIGAYRLDLAGVVEKVAVARQSGAKGVVVFSHESLAPSDLRRLREEAFPPRVASAEGSRSGGRVTGSR